MRSGFRGDVNKLMFMRLVIKYWYHSIVQ